MQPADQYISLVLQPEFGQGHSMNKSELAIPRQDLDDDESLGSSAESLA